MYSNTVKIGKAIVVHGACAGAGTSTVAAMTASFFAAQGARTLLLSTDADIPHDAVSMLSETIVSNHMDDLVTLETSGSFTVDRLSDYVSMLTDNLGYMRASTKLSHMAKDPARTLNRIVEAACHDYHYVIVDIGYAHTPYVDDVIAKSDLVMHVLTQVPKTIERTEHLYKHDHFGDRYVVPVVGIYHEDLATSTRAIAKALGVDDVYALHHAAEVYNIGTGRNAADYIYKRCVRRNKGLRRSKLAEDDMVVFDELAAICRLIEAAIVDKGGES